MRRIVSVLLAAMVMTVALANPAAAKKSDEPEMLVIRVTSGEVEDLADEHDFAVVDTLIASRGVYVIEVVDPGKKFEKDLEKDRRVAWVEDYEVERAGDDHWYAWPATEVVGAAEADLGGWSEALRLDEIHQSTTGDGVVVAVIDTGLDVSHPHFEGRARAGWDLVDDDADVSESRNGVDDDGDGVADEAFGHGTHVAGVIHILAPDAEIVGYRALNDDGEGDVTLIAEAINMAVEDGADVINLSFGTATKPKSKLLKEALKDAKSEGVTVVAAAGNDGGSAKRYPAAEKDVVSVGAFNHGGSGSATFSSRGKWVDVSAPGVDVTSALPGGGYGTWSGTSMAAPVVTGQAALLYQLDPDPKPSDVRKWIRDSADKDGGDTDKGRINIFDSLRKAR